MNHEATPGECSPVLAKPQTRRVWNVLIVVVGGVLLEASLIYTATRTGMWLTPVGGPLLFVPLLLLYVGVCRGAIHFCLTPSLSVAIRITYWILPILYFVMTGWRDGTPKAMFERLVMNPMPSSVRDFKWSGGVGIDGCFFISFKAAPEDLRKLAEHLGLKLNPDSEWFSLPTEPGTTNLLPVYASAFAGRTNLSGVEIFNFVLSNRCLGTKLPYVWLESPAVYDATKSNVSVWRPLLFYDSIRQLAYLYR